MKWLYEGSRVSLYSVALLDSLEFSVLIPKGRWQIHQTSVCPTRSTLGHCLLCHGAWTHHIYSKLYLSEVLHHFGQESGCFRRRWERGRSLWLGSSLNSLPGCCLALAGFSTGLWSSKGDPSETFSPTHSPLFGYWLWEKLGSASPWILYCPLWSPYILPTTVPWYKKPPHIMPIWVPSVSHQILESLEVHPGKFFFASVGFENCHLQNKAISKFVQENSYCRHHLSGTTLLTSVILNTDQSKPSTGSPVTLLYNLSFLFYIKKTKSQWFAEENLHKPTLGMALLDQWSLATRNFHSCSSCFGCSKSWLLFEIHHLSKIG